MLLVGLVCGVAAADTPTERAAHWVGRLADPARAEQACDQLRELGRAAVPALLEGLKHPDENVRAESAFVLGRIGSKRAVESLIQALEDESARVRQMSAYALGELADKRAAEGLIKLIEDPEDIVRANAAFALGHTGSKEAVPVLILALVDPEASVRNQAASALGFLGDKRALGPLVWVVQNEKEVEVRALATTSLAGLGDVRATGTLVELLNDREVLVRARSIDGLHALTGQRFGYNARRPRGARSAGVKRWRKWFKKNSAKLGSIAPVDPESFRPPEPEPPKPKPEPEKTVPETPEEKPVAPQPMPPPRVRRMMNNQPESDLPPGLPDEVSAQFESALRLYRLGNLPEAVERFRVISESVPALTSALYNRALAEKRLGHYKVAASIYVELLTTAPEHWRARNNLGVIYEILDRPDDARNSYQKALEAGGDAPHLVAGYNLADLFYRKRLFREALSTYDLLWTHRKSLPAGASSAVHLRRMQCKLGLGQTGDLRKLFAAEGPPPDDAGLLRAYADYRTDEVDYAGTKRALVRLLCVDAGNPETIVILARFYLDVPDKRMRNPAQAVVYAEHAVRRKPDEVRYWRTLVDASLACGNTVRAVEALKEIVKLSAGRPEPVERLKKPDAKSAQGEV